MTTHSFRWRETNAPPASSRYDDVWFNDADNGWAVNNDAFTILKTGDGGATWAQQLHDPDMYFRCIAFANERVGWASGLPWTTGVTHRLYHTTDGGANWCLVRNLPNDPEGICGLSVVNPDTAIGSGTNHPLALPSLVKTTDGGATWTLIDMSAHASLLVDNYFIDANCGWVVGGKIFDEVENPTREHAKPVVLYTEDGGATWVDRVESIRDELLVGEWGWKIFFLDAHIGFVTLQSNSWAAILRTDNAGADWTRLPVSEPAGIRNLQGVGFVDSNHGWVGGWSRVPSMTMDGGNTWSAAGPPLRAINRFRFLRDSGLVGYAAGEDVYRYADDSLFWSGNDWEICETSPIMIAVDVPETAGDMKVDVCDGFGWHIACLFEGTAPEPGQYPIEWDFCNQAGVDLGPGIYHVRITVDDRVESKMIERTQ